ncbi:antirestriction protein ArdC [Jatrophihabitans sp. GAS493]|uniref:ArdC-like ssDNA-binding domain-containing protein n=1 Tax=Jatrophihabitans sp. GAS493 TaxID=1907575 RepID=UPI000BB7823D|nr:ArdC-like ssDNA-binding domain-containing protein [Jatrophihabitans sp. GAS493]SOD72874.1 antirestriction protein ArdC [Jatrophihabitans sp. GAS493]
MSQNTKQGKTPEQRKAEREALLTTLGEKVATLASSAEWVNYLRFMTALRRYSFNNLMLIAVQCPHATQVAGFRKWQQLGRQVRKGEKAIKILGYSTKKVTKTDPATGEEIEDRVTRFPVLSVFDLSQTDGDPNPTTTYTLPTGDGPAGTLDRLIGWLTSEGWTVKEEALAGGLEGYTDHTRHLIVTKTDLEPAARLVVLLHETAHALLHVNDAEYVAHRGLCETEAESTAYVLANLLGIDVDASSISYIAGWSNAKPDVLTAAATNVLRAVNTIAAALGLDEDERAGEEANAA